MSDNFGAGSFPPPSSDPFGGDMLPGSPTSRPTAPTQGRGRHKAQKEPKPAKPVTKRSMSIYKIGIVVALVVGLIAVVAIFAPSKKTYVVEASANIPPLAQVTSSDVKAVPLALGDIQSGAFTGTSANAAINNALKSISNQEAAYPIAQGQQLSPSLFNSPQVQSTAIPSGDRLVSISSSTATAVGGTLRPGNIVDMITVLSSSSGATTSYVVAANLQVVAVSTTSATVPTNASKSTNANGTTNTNSSSTSSSTTGVYVLKVPVASVLPVTLGDSQGKVYLVLQGPSPTPIPQTSLPLNCINSTPAAPVAGCP